jgi:hypothetical protein
MSNPSRTHGLPKWLSSKPLPQWLPEAVSLYIEHLCQDYTRTFGSEEPEKAYRKTVGIRKNRPLDRDIDSIEDYTFSDEEGNEGLKAAQNVQLARDGVFYKKVWKAFTSNDMKDVWQETSKLAPTAPQKFGITIIDALREIEADRYAKQEIDRHREIFRALDKKISEIEKLLGSIHEHHVRTKDESEESVTLLKNSYARLQIYFDKEYEQFFIKRPLLSRKMWSDDATHWLMARRLSEFFRGYRNGKRPRHKEVATTINQIFGTTYEANDIIKLLKKRISNKL